MVWDGKETLSHQSTNMTEDLLWASPNISIKKIQKKANTRHTEEIRVNYRIITN